MLFDLLVNFWWFYSVINSEYNVDSVHLSWRFRRFDDVTDTSDVTIERHVLLLIKPLCAVARGHFLSRFCPRHISSAKVRNGKIAQVNSCPSKTLLKQIPAQTNPCSSKFPGHADSQVPARVNFHNNAGEHRTSQLCSAPANYAPVDSAQVNSRWVLK